MAALIVCGLGLRLGIFNGAGAVRRSPSCRRSSRVDPHRDRRLDGARADRPPAPPRGLRRAAAGGSARWAQRLANLPAAASAGMRDALAAPAPPATRRWPARSLFWAFQVAVLWAAFRAFGDAPPLAVLTQAFFVGMFGNLLPMPGGVGGVEGGMIAALAAFGVDAGQAVVAVLLFRAFTFWLPMIPGVIAYFQLRRTVERWRTERRAPRAT